MSEWVFCLTIVCDKLIDGWWAQRITTYQAEMHNQERAIIDSFLPGGRKSTGLSRSAIMKREKCSPRSWMPGAQFIDNKIRSAFLFPNKCTPESAKAARRKSEFFSSTLLDLFIAFSLLHVFCMCVRAARRWRSPWEAVGRLAARLRKAIRASGFTFVDF